MITTDINTTDLSEFRDIFKNYVRKSVKSNDCHDNIKIMVYKHVKFSKYGNSINVSQLVEGIRNDIYRQSNKTKENLPVAYFSVVGFNGKKKDIYVTKHSGLIVFDIDKKDNPEANFTELNQAFQNDKFTHVLFNSPSGGLKVVFLTNIQKIEHHKAYYESIKNYILTQYPSITKIDTSGSHVARACYLPYDKYAYYNQHSYRYCLDDTQIKEISQKIRIKHPTNNSLKPLLEVEFISFNEHFENILNLLKKRTEVGLLDDDNGSEKGTKVGLYDNIFNKFRYKIFEQAIMCTNVPFLELLILKHIYPYHLDYETRLDESYFTNPQMPISTDMIDGLDGLEVCKVKLSDGDVIKEGSRAKTLGSITMKLIFNNPFCHPVYLFRTIKWINDTYCEDPNPVGHPKPNDDEVLNIVLYNYNKFLNGDLNFGSVIRKKRKKEEISKKYVFKSRNYININSTITHLKGVKTFSEGRRHRNMKKYLEAINNLQDGEKITQKRIADYMGMTPRNLRRYNTDEYDELIARYNKTLILQSKEKSRITNYQGFLP